MSGRGPRLRAKDADRLTAVEALEAALGDGQLTSTEAATRIERARAAATLGELAALTSDLQAVPVAGSRPGSRRRLVAAGLAAVVIVGGAGYALTRHHGDDTPAVTTSRISADRPDAAPADDPVDPEPVDSEPVDTAEYSFTAKGVRAFIDVYTEEFKRPPRALAFGLNRSQVVIYRPNQTRGTIHRWFFRQGRFLDDGPEQPTAPVEKPEIDLRKVDLARMFANVRTAQRRASKLNPTVDILGVTLIRDHGHPRVYAIAGNRASGKCVQVVSDFAGRVGATGPYDCS
ncbi:MAG TPA: DUF1707 domain-containing protein [Marmoricola sp.]